MIAIANMDRRAHPALEKADREGREACELGMSRESNPYREAPGVIYGRQWHWDNGWWQVYCDAADRAIVRAN